METLYQQIKSLKESGQFDWLEAVNQSLYHQLNYQYAIYDWLVTHHLLHQSGSYEKAWAHFYNGNVLRASGFTFLSENVFYKSIATMERLVITTATSPQPTRKRIYNAIREQPNISVKELSTQIGVCERVIQRHLNTLTQQGFIRRVNGNRKGKFEIL